MTADRDEFKAARDRGLRKRHARRLLMATTPACVHCDASYAACSTHRWLAGTPCCDRCEHEQERDAS